MTRPLSKLLAASLVLVGMVALLRGQAENEVPAARGMFQAAEKFTKSLSPAQLEKASFKFDDAERLNWHFIPRERKGLPLRDLEGGALKAAQEFIGSGLSKAGYEQTLAIMSLEEVLYLLEGGDRTERRERRNPGKYYLSIFGTPTAKGQWGWRLEGHHLSLNFTLNNGEVVGSTPEFYGTNPALIDAGPERAIRVLGAEEDLARQVLKLSTPEQLKTIVIDTKAPDDLRGANTPQADRTPAVGLAAGQMSADQKKLLNTLLEEYLKNMPADVAAKRRDRLMKAGFDTIQFAWWGEPDRNQRHYYRLQGPTFLIEYNNTQNNANHVHSYWRDLEGDFGIAVK
jgi:hypothetical protein